MSQTYSADIIVLKKTKLGEADLILTCLSADGSQLRCVAKGARKPGNTFSSRLEMFSVAHVLLVSGKSLDMVKEVRLLQGNAALRDSFERSAAAAPMAELLTKVTETGLENPRLFQMTCVALEALCVAPIAVCPGITAAHLLKTFAFCGFSPSLDVCVSCGSPVQAALPEPVRFSYQEGGVVCQECKPHVQSIALDAMELSWVKALLVMRFAEMPDNPLGDKASYAVLQFCQMWSRTHLGSGLRSLEFLMGFAVSAGQEMK